MEWFNAPEKVCLAAMDRACNRDLIEYGVSLRSAWPTEKGKQLIQTQIFDKFVNSLLTGLVQEAIELLNLESRKGGRLALSDDAKELI
jgi:hypothetical protein